MPIPLVVGAVALVAGMVALTRGGSSASAHGASDGAGGSPEAPYDKKAANRARQDAQDAKDATEATKVFAGILGIVGGAIAAAPPSNAPFVAAASAVVATAWASLSMRDKARVWRGELK